MDDLARIEREVATGARRGARSASADRQVVEDAVESTQARFVDAVLGGKQIADWHAWAFRTAENAARRIGSRRRSRHPLGLGANPPVETRTGDEGATVRKSRAELRRAILARKHRLIGRQLEVLLKLCEPGMSFHRAAKEIGMDRTALRRSFQSACERLEHP